MKLANVFRLILLTIISWRRNGRFLICSLISVFRIFEEDSLYLLASSEVSIDDMKLFFAQDFRCSLMQSIFQIFQEDISLCDTEAFLRLLNIIFSQRRRMEDGWWLFDLSLLSASVTF